MIIMLDIDYEHHLRSERTSIVIQTIHVRRTVLDHIHTSEDPLSMDMIVSLDRPDIPVHIECTR